MKQLPDQFPVADIAALLPPRVVGDIMPPQKVKEMFRVLVSFLQQHGLTTHELLAENEIPSETFVIRAGDLTQDGIELFRTGVDNWLGRIDRGKDPHDVTPLERALKKIRSRKR